jgi:hypothetical protein
MIVGVKTINFENNHWEIEENKQFWKINHHQEIGGGWNLTRMQ